MSAAGLELPHGAVVVHSLDYLAPVFRARVQAAVAECRASSLDVVVFETYRSNELQELYWHRGRDVRPPDRPVTNARSNLFSWHGFGLGVDVISEAHGWNQPEAWWQAIAAVFKRNGCKWGGDWKMRDLPHFQFDACKPSPSDQARAILAKDGIEAVWRAVGAAA